ncbi:MAG: hypothetical protein QXI19_06660, partial [Candidatus Caldarchaeum sp.]
SLAPLTLHLKARVMSAKKVRGLIKRIGGSLCQAAQPHFLLLPYPAATSFLRLYGRNPEPTPRIIKKGAVCQAEIKGARG